MQVLPAEEQALEDTALFNATVNKKEIEFGISCSPDRLPTRDKLDAEPFKSSKSCATLEESWSAQAPGASLATPVFPSQQPDVEPSPLLRKVMPKRGRGPCSSEAMAAGAAMGPASQATTALKGRAPGRSNPFKCVRIVDEKAGPEPEPTPTIRPVEPLFAPLASDDEELDGAPTSPEFGSRRKSFSFSMRTSPLLCGKAGPEPEPGPTIGTGFGDDPSVAIPTFNELGGCVVATELRAQAALRHPDRCARSRSVSPIHAVASRASCSRPLEASRCAFAERVGELPQVFAEDASSSLDLTFSCIPGFSAAPSIRWGDTQTSSPTFSRGAHRSCRSRSVSPMVRPGAAAALGSAAALPAASVRRPTAEPEPEYLSPLLPVTPAHSLQRAVAMGREAAPTPPTDWCHSPLSRSLSPVGFRQPSQAAPFQCLFGSATAQHGSSSSSAPAQHIPKLALDKLRAEGLVEEANGGWDSEDEFFSQVGVDSLKAHDGPSHTYVAAPPREPPPAPQQWRESPQRSSQASPWQREVDEEPASLDQSWSGWLRAQEPRRTQLEAAAAARANQTPLPGPGSRGGMSAVVAFCVRGGRFD